MPSDPSLSKKAYHEEAERAGLKKDGQAASGEIRVSSQNFIRTGLHSAVQAYGLVAGQLEKLPQAQRMGVLAIAAFILFWPLFGVVMVVPWIFGGFILAYSLLLGFETLINHTEEALLNELTISPANAGLVKDLSKGLRDNYQSVGKSMLEKGYNFALVAATSGSAVVLQYAQKALNFVISNLQQAKEKTDATSHTVNEKAESLKKFKTASAASGVKAH